jgi:hypothetical protein
MKCTRCSGFKYVGEPFHLFGEFWVDVTCIQCAHSVDIRVEEFNRFVNKVHGSMK